MGEENPLKTLVPVQSKYWTFLIKVVGKLNIGLLIRVVVKLRIIIPSPRFTLQEVLFIQSPYLVLFVVKIWLMIKWGIVITPIRGFPVSLQW